MKKLLAILIITLLTAGALSAQPEPRFPSADTSWANGWGNGKK